MRNRIGIIGAMDVEIALLKDSIAPLAEEAALGASYYRGTLQGREIVLARCGVGKVNAAVCTATLIERFDVGCIVNTGIAGALDEKLAVGDVVVATDFVQHDMDATHFGYEPGFIPQTNTLAFAADPSLVAVAVSAALCVATGAQVVEGRVATGDQFIASAGRKASIRTAFDAACCEMEGAAIAQVCAMAGVPFAALRVISDTADGSGVEFNEEVEVRAARLSATIVLRMLSSMAV